MKNLEKLIIISSIFVSSLAYAQNYGYPQYPQSQQYPYERNGYNYPSSQQGYSQPYNNQMGQYRENNPMGQYREGYRSNEPSKGYSSQETTKRSEHSWIDWFRSGERNVPNVPDEIITRDVIQNLRNTPYFSNLAKNIQVMAKEGRVTLRGKVANRNERNQIEFMVKNVQGVKSVANDLETER
jgi:BON domain